MKNPGLRTTFARYYYGLQKSALEKGLFRGTDDYTKFVIIGRGRTGSTLITTSLASHSQVVMMGEIFRIPGQVVWNSKYGPETEKAQVSAAADPVNFLINKVFRIYPQKVNAVGFKIFYYHAEEGNWKNVWPYLGENNDIHVIHNKRKNILKTQLSDKIAWETGQWADKKKDRSSTTDKPPISVNLDYDELVLWFNLTKKWENQIDSDFADHPKIDVYYEDLEEDYGAELNRIQGFLGLSPEEILPTTQKQSRGSLAEQIQNYSELKERFQGTPWIEFFED